MKMRNRLMCVLLCLMVLSTSVVYAESSIVEDKKLALRDGKLENNDALQALIDDYFTMRETALSSKQLYTKSLEQKIDTMIVSSNAELLTKESERSNVKENMAKYHDVHILNSEVVPVIENAVHIDRAGYEEAYEIDIYEWTWIEYNDGNNGSADKMGYATDHKMTVAEQSNGELIILENVYDDEMFTGEPEPIWNEETLLMSTSDAALKEERVELTGISTANLDVNSIIIYADKWVGRSIAPDSDMGIDGNYNPAYPNWGDEISDCANYVSQCLRAGGLSFDFGSDGVRGNTDDDWWYYAAGADKYTQTSQTWRNVPDFIDHFYSEEGCAYVSATASNVYPGNPVFHYDSEKAKYNHVGICVGYNHNDVPIINAHTRDVYHVPYSYFVSPKTIQIFTRNHLSKTPTDAEIITPSTTVKTDYTVLNGGNNIYYKIKHPTNATASYTLRVTGDCNTAGCTIYIYQQKKGDAYMYELKHGSGNSFGISATLNPDYNYYLRCHADANSGSNGFTLGYQKTS